MRRITIACVLFTLLGCACSENVAYNAGCNKGDKKCSYSLDRIQTCIEWNGVTQWIDEPLCPETTSCNPQTQMCECLENQHSFANKCEDNDIEHCGTHTNDCTRIRGWKTGKCIDKICLAETCDEGYHPVSIFDDNHAEKTVCQEDTHDACGSVNTQCNANEVCTEGKCKDHCNTGEVNCNGSCINPQTSTNYCGADASCSSYVQCEESEQCEHGKCSVTICPKDMDLCTENGQNTCVYTHGDNPNHCGACNSACSDRETAKSNGCKDGKCLYVCSEGMINCGSDTSPICLFVDKLQTDPQNCGKCGNPCSDNQSCKDGLCVTSSCTENKCNFDGNCINEADHCGSQCINCNTANNASEGNCQSGMCLISKCITGFHLSNGICVEDSDKSCPNGNPSEPIDCSTLENTITGICESGMCKAIECSPNAHVENNQCIKNTLQNCGSESANCTKLPGWKSGQCTDGVCEANQCQSDFCLNSLLKKCVNTQTQSLCGIDGNACKSCTSNQVCTNGKCTAKQCQGNVCNQTPDANSALICLNDNAHCGTNCQNCNSFIDFVSKGVCTDNGTCKITSCISGYHIYKNTCETDDINNCGTHGNKCSQMINNAYIDCKDSSCIYKCKEGYIESSGACVLPDDKLFITVWDITSDNTIIEFPIQEFKQPITIDWGDDTSEQITQSEYLPASSYINHTYTKTGKYRITVDGTIKKWSCNKGNNETFCNYLVGIESYGNICFDIYTFYRATNLEHLPDNTTPCFSLNSMKGIFSHATHFNQDISFWNTSNITDMSYLFEFSLSFNQPLNKWNTSNVQNMNSMFRGASSFNQPLSNWNTSNVTDMRSMFDMSNPYPQYSNTASVFNQNLSMWNTSNVKDMSYMFYRASEFNQDLSNWNVNSVSEFNYIFSNSGLSQTNYCKLFRGSYADIWKKYMSKLGLSYSCP